MKIVILFLVFCLSLACAATVPPSQSTAFRPQRVATPMSSEKTANPSRQPPETLNPFTASERRERMRAMLPRMAPMQEVGFVYRPPRGFEDGNPRSHTFLNDTKYAARIFLDGRELTQVMAGGVARTPVMYNGSVHFLPLLPPDAKLFHVGDSDMHTVIVELYAGPAPLMYAMTCQLEANFLLQQIIHLGYRSCHRGNPSP